MRTVLTLHPNKTVEYCSFYWIVLRFKSSSKPKNVLQSCDIGSQLKTVIYCSKIVRIEIATRNIAKTIPLALQSHPKVNKRAIFKSQNTVDCKTFPKYSNWRWKSALTYLSCVNQKCITKQKGWTAKKTHSLKKIVKQKTTRMEPLNLKTNFKPKSQRDW